MIKVKESLQLQVAKRMHEDQVEREARRARRELIRSAFTYERAKQYLFSDYPTRKFFEVFSYLCDESGIRYYSLKNRIERYYTLEEAQEKLRDSGVKGYSIDQLFDRVAEPGAQVLYFRLKEGVYF